MLAFKWAENTVNSETVAAEFFTAKRKPLISLNEVGIDLFEIRSNLVFLKMTPFSMSLELVSGPAEYS